MVHWLNYRVLVASGALISCSMVSISASSIYARDVAVVNPDKMAGKGSSKQVSSSLPLADNHKKAFSLPLAKAFTLKDTTGHLHPLSEYRGRCVALFFFCGCPWCHRCATVWGQFQRNGVLIPISQTLAKKPFHTLLPKSNFSPISLIVFSGDSASVTDFAMQTGLDPKQTILLPDPDMRVTTLYQADPCPRVFVLDSQGLVRYTNSHKDDAPQKASEMVIASRALDALRATSSLHQ